MPSLADTVKGAALVVEAVVERPDVKRTLYAQLETMMEPDAILASNTSNLDIFPLVPQACRHGPSSRIGIRRPICATWSISAPGRRRTPAPSTTVRDIVAAMGKAPVVFKQMVQGYVANRLQAAMQLEVYRLLDEGLVTPKDIDDFGAARAGAAHPDPGDHGEGRFHRAAADAARNEEPQLHAAGATRPQRDAG